MKYIITLLLFVLCTNLYAKSIIISLDNLESNNLELEKLKKLTTIHKVKIYSNKERRAQEYRAFKVVELLNILFPEKWEKYNFIKVESKTGYTPKIQIEQLGIRDAYLAYERTDGEKFQIIDSTSTNLIELSPFYLIWDRGKNLSKQQKKKYRWVYQVISLTISSSMLEKKLSKGEALYNNYCLRCHSIKNSKRKFGPSFFNSNIVQKLGIKSTIKYIKHPKSFKTFSKMPAFPKQKDRAKKIHTIALFLQKAGAIQQNKKRVERVIDVSGLKKLMNQD